MQQRKINKNLLVYNSQSIQTWKNKLIEINNRNDKALHITIINDYMQRLLAATEFLKTLRDTPALLCEKIANLILEKFQEYENNAPAKQPLMTRLCLYNIEEKIKHIISVNITTESKLLNRDMQLTYLQLCGFLWDMFYLNEIENPQFAKLIMSILQITHLPEDGDLPDNLRTRISCVAHFRKLKTLFPNLFALNKKEFKKIERVDFFSIFNTFPCYLKDDDALSKPAQQVAKAVYKDIQQTKNDYPDYKFYTRILKETKTILQEPNNTIAAENYSNLIIHASGQPSLSKKILGGMLGFFGTLLIGTSIAVGVATAAGSLPLSLGGLAIGKAVLHISAGVIASFSTGIFSVTCGCGLFAYGQQHGLAGKMQKFKDKIPSQSVNKFK